MRDHIKDLNENIEKLETQNAEQLKEIQKYHMLQRELDELKTKNDTLSSNLELKITECQDLKMRLNEVEHCRLMHAGNVEELTQKVLVNMFYIVCV